MTVGELARGFRNWTANGFFGDKWKVAGPLDIYFGLRYNVVSAPVEVNGLNQIPFGCDCNNFSPRFSIAWRFAGDWMLRTSYTTSFGEILPVTYQQTRNNAPLVHYFIVQNPDLVNPLRGIDLNDPNVRTSPDDLFRRIWFRPMRTSTTSASSGAWRTATSLRFGYVGSRRFKLVNDYIMNRAEPVPGIPTTMRHGGPAPSRPALLRLQAAS